MSEERDPGSPDPPPTREGTPGVDRGDRVHEFRGQGVTVTWSRRRCIHAAACVMGLPRVFAPGRRPWVDPTQSTADAIARVVVRCPTGALHFARNDGGPAEAVPPENSVAVTRHGPLYVHGEIEVYDESGALRLADVRVALCRCGKSANRPLCDGSHLTTGFQDEGGVHPGTALADPSLVDRTLRVRPQAGGPLEIEGPFSLTSADHRTVLLGSRVKLCRCGGSGNKPFCDGTHLGKAG